MPKDYSIKMNYQPLNLQKETKVEKTRYPLNTIWPEPNEEPNEEVALRLRAKIEIDGIKFDSRKEGSRWIELKMLEKSGSIKNLERQKRFEIVPKTKDERAVYYIADFVYEQDGKLVCEDVKSPATRKDKIYIIKRKLFKYNYPGYEFRES